MKNNVSRLITNKDIVFLETNNKVLGHVCKVFKNVAKCKSIMESQKIVGLLGCLSSIMYDEESEEIEVSIEMPTQNNYIMQIVKIGVRMELISLLSDELNSYDVKKEELRLKRVCLSEENEICLGESIKDAVSNLILNSKSKENFKKNVFLNIVKIIGDGVMSSSFNIELPLSNNLINLSFSCIIDEVTMH
jgi:hypothetical protein